MILYGLRLLVALLTFAFGVAAAWLFNFESQKRSAVLFVESEQLRVSVIASRNEPPMPACSGKRPKFVYQGRPLNEMAEDYAAPVYPPAARAAGVEGSVVVRVTVDKGGRVLTAEAKSGPEPLREAAVEAARRTRFTPELRTGQPVRSPGDITYNFVLD